MIHLPSLPGSPNNLLGINDILSFAFGELDTLVSGGIDGIIVENFHDYPFYPQSVEPITIASMAIVTQALVQKSTVPIGVNILRNACSEALSIAALTNASFIRCNIWTGAYVTDQGIITGCAHTVKRLQKTLAAANNCTSPLIFVDVHCKHASPLSNRPLELEVIDTFDRGAADAVIITGERTGLPAKIENLQMLHKKKIHPILIGSGVTSENVELFLPYADGAIVGSSLKRNCKIDEPTALKKVQNLVAKARNID